MIYLVKVCSASGCEVLFAFHSEALANSERDHLEAVPVNGCTYHVEAVEVKDA